MASLTPSLLPTASGFEQLDHFAAPAPVLGLLDFHHYHFCVTRCSLDGTLFALLSVFEFQKVKEKRLGFYFLRAYGIPNIPLKVFCYGGDQLIFFICSVQFLGKAPHMGSIISVVGFLISVILAEFHLSGPARLNVFISVFISKFQLKVFKGVCFILYCIKPSGSSITERITNHA